MNHVPATWTFVLLGLACYRLTRLVGWDVVTRPLREPLTGREEHGGAKDARSSSKGRKRPWYRSTLDDFVHCPFCQGWWICLAVWGLWLEWPHVVTVLSVPWALSALVGLTTKNLDT